MAVSDWYLAIAGWYSSLAKAEMAVPIFYAIITGSSLLLRLLYCLVYWSISAICRGLAFLALKYHFHPQIPRRVPVIGKATIHQMLIWLAYFGVNIGCMTIGTTSNAEISARSATMSIINIIPLLSGPRLVMITKFMGITLQTHHMAHQWIGQTVVVQVLIHSILGATQNSPFRWTKQSISGVAGSSALGILLVLSFRLVRRVVYEWFLTTHFILTVILLLAIWLHLSQKKPAATIFLFVGLGFWVVMTVVHALSLAVRNLVRGKSLGVARVAVLPGALRITITPPRPWQVEAGDFVFLSIPAAGVRSAVQFHPFMVAWWERGRDGLTISCLVKPRRGFTSKLAALSDRERLVLIDGPYGVNYDFGLSGTVVMFATGIGIAGQLPYIKELINGYNNCVVSTRRIMLVWQLDREVHQQWVKAWMDEIIEMDTGHVLQIDLYVRERGVEESVPDMGATSSNPNQATIIQYGTHRKLNKIFAPPDIDAILEAEFAVRKGNIVISVCAKGAFASQVRRGVRERMDVGVRLVELDFEPSMRRYRRGWYRSAWSRSTREQNDAINMDMDFHCRGQT